jgi:hypothetical protein
MALAWNGSVLLIKQNKIEKGMIPQKKWIKSALKIKAKKNRKENDMQKIK